MRPQKKMIAQPKLLQDEKSAVPVRVGEKLIAANMITQDQLRIGLLEQRKTGEKLGDILVRLGFLDETTLTSLLAVKTGIERINLASLLLDTKLLQQLPRHVAEKHKAIPVRSAGAVIEVAMADPHDLVAIDQIRLYFPRHFDIAPLIANASDIQSAIESYYGFTSSIELILGEIEQQPDSFQVEHPVIRLVNNLLGDAVKQGASDVHLEPENNMVRVRYRIDGVLQQMRALHLSHWPALSQRVKLMSGMNIADQRSVQDGRFSLALGGQEIDFRVSIMPTVWGENIVLRVLDKRRALVSLTDLGFSGATFEALTRITDRPQGITLVTGPTGSGKTTTLYSLLSRLSTPEVHVATLEEPVEYQMNMIRQTSVAEGQGLSFAEGIRAVLRQDPDIIFIGEIRDADTAQMALRAAMTGHQVFATLHCNDVWGAVPRLVDLGLNPRLLAGHLSGLIAQRLVRKLCPHCKVSVKASAEESSFLKADPMDPLTLCVPVGCSYCFETGRKGRTVVAEVLPITPAMDDLLAEQGNTKDLRKQALAEGFCSMQVNGLSRVLSGEMALADLRRSVDMTRGL